MPVNQDEIHPKEIRTIRQSLGLSQVQAGEILGGGTRAFTKYENGSVKPAASIVNLLRLLEANPSLLTSLTGDALPLVSSSANTEPYEVTSEHIQALDPQELTCLLEKLLIAESNSNNLPADNIHVAKNITAPDGGEDGRISWESGPERTQFLPSRHNQFQLKAGAIIPAKVEREVVAKSGEAKDFVRSTLESGGCYILLCACDYTQKSINDRAKRMREALRNAGVAFNHNQIQFRDAGQIAIWTNSYPAVAIWVKEKTQPNSVGPFQSLAYWSGRAEHESSLWIGDDERIHAIYTRLIEQVDKPRGILRVEGLSGIGKSRLILEALRPTETAARPITDQVLYVNMIEADRTSIINVVQALVDIRKRALMIVDRCPYEFHQILSGIILRSSSCISLVTVDNEIRNQAPDETTYIVDRAPESVIKGIIDQELPNLPQLDHRRLVNFSNGFPKIAIQIARAWSKSNPISEFGDDELINEFILGRNPRERELVLESATLLATFGLIGIEKGLDTNLREIASQARNLSALDLRVGLLRLVERGIAQRRGRFVALQPRPISMKLTERQWREWGPDNWEQVLAGNMSSDLKRLAARQLAMINMTDISQRVVVHVCRPNGRFDNDGLKNDAYSEILSAFAEIDASVAVNQIRRLTDRIDDLSTIDDRVRSDVKRALVKIAFLEETFEDGAHLLLRFAIAESKRNIDNIATRQFVALFPLLAGNTAADGKARLSMLAEVANTDDATQGAIVLEALKEGAKTALYSRFVGAEIHGSRPALREWQPANDDEADDYIKKMVSFLAEFAEKEDELGLKARTHLGRHLRSLLACGFVETVESIIHRIHQQHGEWKEAMQSLGDFLAHDISDADRELAVRLRKLYTDLQPEDLKSRIRFLVSEMPWDFPNDEELDFEARKQKQIEVICTLANEVAEHPFELKQVLPQISQGQQRMATLFGEQIANSVSCPKEWLRLISESVIETPENQRNFDLLAGYLTGIATKHPGLVNEFKERAAQSTDLAPALPLTCWLLDIVESDIDLVIGALRAGNLSPERLTYWTVGGKLAQVPAPTVAKLVDFTFDHSENSFFIGIELLNMYVYRALDRLEFLRPQVKKIAENLQKWQLPNSKSTMHAYYFETIMTWILEKGREDEDARTIALILAKVLSNDMNLDVANFLKPIIPLLLSRFPEITWPIIGQTIVSSRKKAWHFEYILGDNFSFDRDNSPPILNLPEDTLIAWCHAHSDDAPAFAAAIVPVLSSQNIDAPARSIHPVMARLIDEFSDCKGMLDAVDRNIHTYSWSGSSVDYYELYPEPIGTLLNHSKGQVRQWARNQLRNLEYSIAARQNKEQEFEALNEFC